MIGTLSRTATLLFAAGILLVGHGLQLTLLAVHAQTAGWSSLAIGLTGSCYFLGFVAGCLVLPGVVSGVGHIRCFMVMAAIATVALLSAGLLVAPAPWMLFRFATGFALSGLYMVIESWLSDVSPDEQRGTVLAIYSLISLLGMAGGQVLMRTGQPGELQLFVLAAILMAIAIVPIGLTRVASPNPIPPIHPASRVLIRISSASIVSAVFVGMVSGAFWTLGPVLGGAFGLDVGQVGTMMGFGIAGGALLQLPVGRLSDIVMDRRTVIGAMALAGAVVGLLGFFAADRSPLALYGVMFMLGAAMLPIYALCIAHAGDDTELTLVQITSGILIVHSIGSILGPMLVAALMDHISPRSFFAYASVCMLTAACWTLSRRLAGVRRHDREAHAVILPKTTQVVAELSPDATANSDGAADE